MSDVQTLPVVAGHNLLRLDTNFKRLRDAINEEVLHLIGGNNTMKQDLDMNSHAILNANVDLSDGTSLVTVDAVKQLIAELFGDDIGTVINEYFTTGIDETTLNTLTQRIVENIAQQIVVNEELREEFSQLVLQTLQSIIDGEGELSEDLANLILDVLVNNIENQIIKDKLESLVSELLPDLPDGGDVVFESVRTESFFRGKTVQLVPDVNGNVTVDWAAGTVYQLDTQSTPAEEIYMTMINMPSVEDDEEQTIYVDLINGGNTPIIVDSAFTLEFPDITTRIAEGPPDLTVDGRDYILAASNNGTTITVVFIYDVGPDPAHPSSET